MRVRDLERLLTANGVGAAKVDAITRRLRHSGRLPKGGRGTNAPHIGASEAAAILLSIAGSTKGAEADIRLAKLESLPCVSADASGSLLVALTNLLEDGAQLASLREVRVGRTNRRAAFIYSDGRISEYHRAPGGPASDRFFVEAVLPRPLLEKVAAELHNDGSGLEQRARRRS